MLGLAGPGCCSGRAGQGFSAQMRMVGLCTCTPNSAALASMRRASAAFSVAEIGFRRTDVLGVDEREFARFGDAECRIGKFVPLCGGEAVVRFGLCRHGCCSIGVVAGIRKFPASHRFFAQRLLRCPMCFAR